VTWTHQRGCMESLGLCIGAVPRRCFQQPTAHNLQCSVGLLLLQLNLVKEAVQMNTVSTAWIGNSVSLRNPAAFRTINGGRSKIKCAAVTVKERATLGTDGRTPVSFAPLINVSNLHSHVFRAPAWTRHTVESRLRTSHDPLPLSLPVWYTCQGGYVRRSLATFS
jgi:hypothetical protein